MRRLIAHVAALLTGSHILMTSMVGVVLFSSQTLRANLTVGNPTHYLAFNNPTDTISVTGNTAFTNQATYEAIVTQNSSANPGQVWCSWQQGTQDDGLALEPGGSASADAYPGGSAIGSAAGSLTLGTWYDVAYVYDGSQERLYINGVLAASGTASGNISHGSSNTMSIGAIHRDGIIASSFIGDIQSLRISNTARYSGNSYTPTFSDFSNDSSTLLLYNFDQLSAGATTITDASGNGHTGTFGAGFSTATSPTVVVPEPAALGALAFGISIVFKRRPR